MKMKSIPGGVLGIVGGALVLVSGIIMLVQIMPLLQLGGFSPVIAIWIAMYVIGGVLGIVGGATALSKNNVSGGIVQAVGLVVTIVGIILGFSILAIISAIVLLAGVI